MKVIVRSSSLVFVFGNLLLGLPMRRRRPGDSGSGWAGRGAVGESGNAGGARQEGRFGWSVLTPQQDNSAAKPVAEQDY